MLDSNLRTQLKAYLERVSQPIELVASLDDRAASQEMRELLQDIAGLSDRIALRLDGEMAGDVTGSHVVWDIFRRVPKRASPVALGGRIYMVNDEGILTCLNAKDGSELWSDRLRGHFSASALAVDGRVYFFSEMGDAFVIAQGDEFELLATNHFDEGFMASPAVAGKAFFLRTRTHVYRVEGK